MGQHASTTQPYDFARPSPQKMASESKTIVARNTIATPTRKSRNRHRDWEMLGSSPSSAQTPLSSSDPDSLFHEYELNGFTQEEVEVYNHMASPHQRLKRHSESLANDQEHLFPGSEPEWDPASEPESEPEPKPEPILFPVSKQMNLYIRQHPFFLQKLIVPFHTSDRRAFERDVYDHARALNIPSRNAKKQVIKAREICGEENYDSNDSALEGEINRSSKATKRSSQNDETPLDTLRRLGRLGNLDGMIIPSIEDQDSRPMGNGVPSAPIYFGNDVARSAILGPEQTEKSERRARKRARREGKKKKAAEQERKNRDRTYGSPAGSSAPETKQAHNNHVKSSGLDHEEPKHSDGSYGGRTEREMLKQVQGLRDFSNTKQAERFEHGGIKGASKGMKNDLIEKKEDRDYLQGDRRGKTQKRKAEAQQEATITKKSRRDKSHKTKSDAGTTQDFQHPMI